MKSFGLRSVRMRGVGQPRAFLSLIRPIDDQDVGDLASASKPKAVAKPDCPPPTIRTSSAGRPSGPTFRFEPGRRGMRRFGEVGAHLGLQRGSGRYS